MKEIISYYKSNLLSLVLTRKLITKKPQQSLGSTKNVIAQSILSNQFLGLKEAKKAFQILTVNSKLLPYHRDLKVCGVPRSNLHKIILADFLFSKFLAITGCSFCIPELLNRSRSAASEQ